MKSRIEIKTEDLQRQAAYRRALLREPQLQQLFVELTDKCNLACRHCGSSCSASNGTYLDAELLIGALQTLAADYGVKQTLICFTGGEPLLHPQFERIVREVNRLGFAWGITTNGTMIDEEMAKKLKALRMGSISLSIDGLRASHNHFRGAKRDNYQKTLDAIQYLHAQGLPVQVTTVVHRENFHELEELYREMLKTRIYSWRLINVEPIGRALASGNLLLNGEQMHRLLDFVREKRFASKETGMDVCYGCSHYLSTAYERDVRDHCFMCGAGIFVGSILCNGDIYSCLDIERRPELVQGNIAKDNFYTVWKHRFKAFREDRAEQNDTCRTCADREFCHGDSMHTWDFEHRKPRWCIYDLK